MRKVPLRLDAPSVRSPEIVIPSAGALSTTLQSLRSARRSLGLRVSGAVAPSAPLARFSHRVGGKLRLVAFWRKCFRMQLLHRDFRLTLDPLLRPDRRNVKLEPLWKSFRTPTARATCASTCPRTSRCQASIQQSPLALLQQCPAATVTPLVDAADLARKAWRGFGVSSKDERGRMGLGQFQGAGRGLCDRLRCGSGGW